MEHGDRQGSSRNVARILAIVDALAVAADSGLKLSDLMRATGLNKTTTHRLLSSLAAHGLADYDAGSGRHFVGVRLITLAAAAKRRFQLTPHVEPALARLSRQTQDTVMLGARVGDEALCLECWEGSFPIKALTLRAGDRRPLGIGAPGVALLAFLPDREIDRILAANVDARSEFPFDEIQIREMITRARKSGYAYNDIHVFKGMETITDMAAVSVPIRAPGGLPVAALSVAAITQRLAPPRRDNIVAALRREVKAIEASYAPILAEMQPNQAMAAPSTPEAIAIEHEQTATPRRRGKA
jgi:DNA-binding IclR family transcriptional regulator